MRKQRTLIQKISFMVLTCSLISPCSVMASTAQDIAAASGGLIEANHGALVSAVTNEKEFIPVFEHAITSVLRVCDASELIEYPFQYKAHGRIYEISQDKVQVLLSRRLYVQDWLNVQVPAIIPAGTDYQDAIRILFDYIVANYSYDYDAPDDFYVSHDSQGAYRIILTGQGICSGYSKLFRGMVEYLPFNSHGVVDYEAQDTFHLSVALVSWSDGTWGHEWNAIQDPFDHLWYHYDLSQTVVDQTSAPLYRLSADELVKDLCHGHISQHVYEF